MTSAMNPMITWGDFLRFYKLHSSSQGHCADRTIPQKMWHSVIAQMLSRIPYFKKNIYIYIQWRFKTAMWVWFKLKRPEHVIVSYTKCGSVSPLVIWVQTCSTSISKNGRVTHDFCLVTFTSDLGGWLNHWWFLVFDPKHVWFQQLHETQKGNLTTET